MAAWQWVFIGDFIYRKATKSQRFLIQKFGTKFQVFAVIEWQPRAIENEQSEKLCETQKRK